MKNQTDLITSIVAGVVAIIGVVIIFVTKREPVKPAEAPVATLSTPVLPKGDVILANGLGGGNNAGGMGGMGGGRGGPMGMGGPMGPMGGPMGAPMGGPPAGAMGLSRPGAPTMSK